MTNLMRQTWACLLVLYSELPIQGGFRSTLSTKCTEHAMNIAAQSALKCSRETCYSNACCWFILPGPLVREVRITVTASSEQDALVCHIVMRTTICCMRLSLQIWVWCPLVVRKVVLRFPAMHFLGRQTSGTHILQQ